MQSIVRSLAWAAPLLAMGCAGAAPATTGAVAPPVAPSEDAIAASAEPASKAEPSAPVADVETGAAAPKSLPSTPLAVPSECAGAADRCVPPQRFVRALCQRTAPEVALAMFKKGTPWTRAYMRLDRELWFAGKRLARPVIATQGEELLILADRTGGSGVMIGGGSYDALRWDGSCVSVTADEVSLSAPRVPEVATITWRYLPDATRDLLLQDSNIESKYRERSKRCRPPAGDACDEADRELSQLIATHVRGGGEVPVPDLSAW